MIESIDQKTNWKHGLHMTAFKAQSLFNATCGTMQSPPLHSLGLLSNFTLEAKINFRTVILTFLYHLFWNLFPFNQLILPSSFLSFPFFLIYLSFNYNGKSITLIFSWFYTTSRKVKEIDPRMFEQNLIEISKVCEIVTNQTQIGNLLWASL